MIIQNAIYGIYGLPWSGKSMLAMTLASIYQRIYWNLEIKKNGFVVSNQVANVSEISRIPFNKKKGVVILDESGLNINSRRSADDANLEFWKLAMLSRKKNVDIFVIAQLDYSVDKYLRDLSVYTFNMSSYFWDSGLMFSIMIKDRFGQILGNKEIDMIEYMRLTGYSYETLDESVIDRKDVESWRENRLSKRELKNNPLFMLTV